MDNRKDTARQGVPSALPEKRCCHKNCWGLIAIVLVGFLAFSCTRNHKGSGQEQSDNSYHHSPEPYPRPYTYTPREKTPTTQSEDTKEAKETVKPQTPAQTPVTISEYYQEGYDKGYDDGEDDAVMGNGFEGQYDDDCHYKGQKRKDYEEGYSDGYEAGYFDNKDYE